MIPVYKIVKVRMPYCPTCGEQLRGDNSYINPYVCKCGTWNHDWGEVGFTIYPEDLT